MPAYGTVQGVTTPAPQATVVALSPTNGRQTREIPAVLDSGSAMTCVPMADIRRLGRNLEYSYMLCQGPVGKPERRRVYIINLRIADCGTVFEDVEVVAIGRDYALIGRDILNSYKVVLDGSHLQWTHDSPSPQIP